MRSLTRIATRTVFGGLVVAGLGFGASQAFAAPETGRNVAGTCLKEDAAACNANCRETYGLGWVGECYRNQFGHVSCGCRRLGFP